MESNVLLGFTPVASLPQAIKSPREYADSLNEPGPSTITPTSSNLSSQGSLGSLGFRPSSLPKSPSGKSYFVGPEGRAGPAHDLNMSRDLAPVLMRNREWSRRKLREDPGYFNRLCAQQAPEYFWVGCADSRVPANVVLGLEPGEVFTQRNVGNQAMHTDMNCMACLEYAVKELKVKIIIVGGHYGCGAVKAALRWPSSHPGMCNMWISDIREARNQHMQELVGLDQNEQLERLCEINVMRQVFHVSTSPVVQEAWTNGQALSVYGLIYSLKDGLVKELVGPLRGNTDFELDKALFEERSLVCDSPVGHHRISDSANPLDTRAMVEKLAAHTGWSKQSL